MHITFFFIAASISAFMALVNTLQYSFNRDKAYLVYAVYLGISALNIYQLTFVTDYHTYAVGAIWSISFLQRLTLISYIGFSITFFKNDVHNAPILTIWKRIFGVFVCLALIELSIFLYDGNHSFLWIVQRSFTAIRLVLSLICIYQIRFIQSPLRPFYLTGTLFLWMGIFISLVFPQNLVQADVLYLNPFVYHIFFSTLEFLCFTVGLSYRSTIILEQKQAQINQERLEKEQIRNNIAADLHDDLGADLSTIRLLGERAQRSLDSNEKNHQIQTITGQTNDLIEKMSTIIWAMNSDNDTVESLVHYIRFYAFDYLKDTHRLNLHFPLPDLTPSVLAQNLTGSTRRDVFFTVKEVLHNVVKHAGATTVTLSIQLKNNGLEIHIHDNGKGLIQANPFGNGLKNTTKRMTKIGGQCVIANAPTGGVQVLLSLPLD